MFGRLALVDAPHVCRRGELNFKHGSRGSEAASGAIVVPPADATLLPSPAIPFSGCAIVTTKSSTVRGLVAVGMVS